MISDSFVLSQGYDPQGRSTRQSYAEEDQAMQRESFARSNQAAMYAAMEAANKQRERQAFTPYQEGAQKNLAAFEAAKGINPLQLLDYYSPVDKADYTNTAGVANVPGRPVRNPLTDEWEMSPARDVPVSAEEYAYLSAQKRRLLGLPEHQAQQPRVGFAWNPERAAYMLAEQGAEQPIGSSQTAMRTPLTSAEQAEMQSLMARKKGVPITNEMPATAKARHWWRNAVNENPLWYGVTPVGAATAIYDASRSASDFAARATADDWAQGPYSMAVKTKNLGAWLKNQLGGLVGDRNVSEYEDAWLPDEWTTSVPPVTARDIHEARIRQGLPIR